MVLKAQTFQLNLCYLLLVIGFSCSSPKLPSEIPEHEITEDSLKIDSLSLDNSLNTIVDATGSLSKSNLEIAGDSLISWGFRDTTTAYFNDLNSFKNHWWLRIFHRRSKDSLLFPTQSDYQAIKSIKQTEFKKGWKFILETWTLKDRESANKWLQIANRTRRIDDLKPPRVYWKDGNTLYFIMATAAKDWFEHGNSLIEIATGRKRILVEIFSNPLNTVHYKERHRGANSSTFTNYQPYTYLPDSTGHMYRYFWFHDLRRRSETKDDAFNGLELYTFIFGESIGTYEDVKEEFIGVKSRLPDHFLGALDLVNKPVSYIENEIGISKTNDNFWIATHDRDYLILHVENDSVDWFKFIKTNLKDASFDKLPPSLLTF